MQFIRILVALSVCAGAVIAQSDRGSVTGTVSDPAHAVVPGARVVARNAETGTTAETTATETGNYTLPSLPAGVYQITAEAAGFKKAISEGLRIQVAQIARLDLTLEVGAATDSVTVQADTQLLKTENAEQSINVTGDRINALPLNFGGGPGSTGSIRNWLSFAILAPGVSGSAYNSPMNGQPGGAFKVYLEGQDITSSNDTSWTTSVAAASVEAIGEFTMQTSNFSAEYGQVLGGFFNFTTKSGTNQFHGSAYEYFANEALDASRHFGGARGLDRKSDYGFSVGGPVWIPKIYKGRNRTFFFFNYEGYHDVTRSTGTYSTVPTAAYRTGDFSAALSGRILGKAPDGSAILENVVYDPTTNFPINGLVYRTPFPSNTIPQSRMDPVALKIQALYPTPINTQLINNWLPDTQNHLFQNIPSVKLDHAFSDSAKISGYYSVQNTDQVTSTDGLPIPLTGRRDQMIYGKTVRVNFDQSLTPHMLLHLGAGYLRFFNPDSAPEGDFSYDAVKGIGFSGSALGSGFPQLGGTSNGSFGGMGMGVGPNHGNRYHNDKLTGVASLSWVRDNHTYKIGGEFKQEEYINANRTFSTGFLNFSSNDTGLPALQGISLPGTVGMTYASFLLGLVNSASLNAVSDPEWRKKAFSVYIQDNWKITRKLTLDYGLRWDLQGQGDEIWHRVRSFSATVANPSAGGLPGGYQYEGYGPGRCNCKFFHDYPYALGPRLGAAYQIDPKTVLRAGWGLSYTAGPNWWYLVGANGVGWNSLSFSTPAYGTPALQLKNGLQYSNSDLYNAALNPGLAPAPGQLNSPSPNYDHNAGRPGRVNQWNISLQREILKDLVVEAAFVGNRGVWLEANNLVAPNAMNPATLQRYGLDLNNAADRTLLTSRLDSTTAIARGFKVPYAGYPTSATVAQSLRPFPQFGGGLGQSWSALGNSWYDALQVQVTKRLSRGLNVTSSFTYQNEEARGSGGNPGASGGGINNVFNREIQKSLTSYSTPLVLGIGFNYQTPRVGPNRLVRTVVGGWDIGGVLRYSSGALIGVPGSLNSLNSQIFQGTRMNRVAGQPVFQKDPNCQCIDANKDFVLNPAAWSDAAPGQWGVSAPYYNDYRWQHSANENINLGRTFQIRERTTFQVRAEFFNAFNRLSMPGPSSGNPQQTQTYNTLGVPTGGFGYISVNGVNSQRNGQLVARFQF